MRWVLFCVLVGLGVHAQGAPLTAEDAVRLSLAHHPSVLRAQVAVEAQEGAARAAGRLLHHNPDFGVEAGATTSGGELDMEVGLSQPLELGGQRGARRAQAEASLRRARAQLQQAQLEVKTQVLEAYAAALAAKALGEVAEAEAKLALQLLEGTRAQHQTGAATELDLNARLLETGEARAAALAARREVREALRGLASALGHPLPQEVTLVGSLQTVGTLLPEVPPLAEAPALEERLTARPELVALRQTRDEAEAALHLVRREAFPTPSLGVLYKRAGAEGVLAGTLAVELPLFNRAQAERAEAHGALSDSQVTYEAALREARAQAHAALAQYAAAQEEQALYEGELDEAAERTAALAQDAWRSGKLGLEEALALQRAALATKAASIHARLRWVRARAQVIRALGGHPEG